MKNKIIEVMLIVVIAIILIVGGILLKDNKNKPVEKTISKVENVYSLKVAGKDIVLNEVYDEEKLGKAESCFEVPSCAFEGMDKLYSYENYQIQTYQDGNEDKIFSIDLLNENIQTTEGIKIGSTLEEMKKVYGENYTQNDTEYTYTLGKTTINFIVEDEKIATVNYTYVMNN